MLRLGVAGCIACRPTRAEHCGWADASLGERRFLGFGPQETTGRVSPSVEKPDAGEPQPGRVHLGGCGQVGVVGHIQIGDRAIVGAQSGISKNVPPGETWFGYPATPLREMKERLAYIGRLEKLYARVRKLEQVLDANGISSSEDT